MGGLGRRRATRGVALLAAMVAALAIVAASGATGRATVPGAASDVRFLADQMEGLHPNLFATVPRTRFRTAVAKLAARANGLSEDELLVELMRLAAMPGTGNGHTGIFPGDPEHRRQLHLYPFRLYTFPSGTYVVDALDSNLVGARLTMIGGHPYGEVERRVRPLVPHDNGSSLRGLLPHYALTAEVLDGLSLADGVGALSFAFKLDGRTLRATVEPLSAAKYTKTFADPHVGHYPSILPRLEPAPMYLDRSASALWVGTIDRNRAVFVGYNAVTVPTDESAKRLLALAKSPKVDRVIVDLRLNGGGDNTTYGPLLTALQNSRINQQGRLFVLIGRATFSAAANFAADVDRSTHAIFVGEPTGGGVKIYGDAIPVALPASGIEARIASRYWDFGKGRADHRVAIDPDIPVPVTLQDFLAGRDPVLAAALAAK